MARSKAVFLGLGSNVGERYDLLESALKKLRRLSVGNFLRVSPLYETPALLPENAPPTWDIPYLNLVCEIHTQKDAFELLKNTQKIEAELGRTRSKKWEPRTLDIDILAFDNDTLHTDELTLPHPLMQERAFVLDPLKDLAPHMKISQHSFALDAARRHPEHSPVFMGIINLTPDSFSDGGEISSPEKLEAFLENVDKSVAMLDIGAESTRPGAKLLTWKEEWSRLEPALKLIHRRYSNTNLRPLLSLDTRHGEVAARAIELGIDIINDVSGATSEGLIKVVAESRCQYVLMHSLSVPADKSLTLPQNADVTAFLKTWFAEKLEFLTAQNVSLDKVILDPGIGFGKTPAQSAEILANVKDFYCLKCRVLIGHSRKSFFNTITSKTFKDRDIESMAVSMKLGSAGVDILRVHNPLLHQAAWRALSWIRSKEKR